MKEKDKYHLFKFWINNNYKERRIKNRENK